MQAKAIVLDDCRLGDVISLKHGYAFKSQYFSNKGNKIVTTPGNFIDQGGFKHKGHNKEKWYDGPVPDGFELSKGDLIVAMTEQMYGLLGSSAVIPESNKYLHNQRLGLVNSIDENRLDKKFLYYLFNAKYVRDQIQATANGAKVRHTSIPKIYDIKVKLPSLEYQRFVGEAFNNYDKLIENNNHRITILEDIAQSLYQEWFVKFRFPGHQNTKFKESSLGSIPEEWEVRKFKDELLIKNGFAFKSKDYSDSGTLIIRTKDFALSKYINVKESVFLPDELLEKHNKYHIQEMDFLLVMVGASIGKYGIVYKKDLPALQNQNMWAIRPNTQTKLSRTYILLSMKNHIDKVIGFATGAAREFFRKEFFNNQDIILPSNTILSDFESMVMPMMSEVGILLEKNCNLKNQRDFLLPRLISGSIDL